MLQKMKRFFLLILIIFSTVQETYSQFNQFDLIVDTSANQSTNLSYNTGEVYVTFTIQNQQVISREPGEIVDDLSGEIITEKISIYPNPVTNILTIVTSNKKKVSEVKLYSMDGKLILDKKIQNNKIDLSDLTQGTYILKTDFSETSNFKLIKL